MSSLSNSTSSSILFRSRRGSFKTGCLIATGILLLLIIGGGVLVAFKWKGWVGTMARSGTVSIVNSSQMPADQKQKVIGKIDEVTRDFESGKIDSQQFAKIFEELAQGPLLPLAIVYGIDEQHIKNSSLPKEEKEAGRLALERASRGIVEKSIALQTIKDIMAPVTIQGPNNQMQMKQVVTDEELRPFFKNAKTRADEAQIPNEPYKVNVGDELSKAIDTALGRTTNPAPATTPSVPPAKDEKK